MVYAIAWNEAAPIGASVSASTLDTELQNLKKSLRERLEDMFPDWTDDSTDPKVFQRARATLTVDEEIANSSATFIPWDQVSYDTEGTSTGFWDSGAATRFTIQVTGIYLVIAQIAWEGSGGTSKQIRLKLNDGATAIAFMNGIGKDTLEHVVWMGSLTAADYLEVEVTHNVGVAHDVLATGAYFAITKLP